MPHVVPQPGGSVSIDGVSRSFGERRVLTDVSARFEAGTVATIHGDNGSGKTSLLRIVAGVLSPDRGTVEVGDGPGRSAVGFVPAGDRMLHWRLSGLQNLEFLGGLAGLERNAARARAATVAGALGAGDLLDRRVGECSTGQRRRLMLVAGFTTASSVVLLDEPLADLDDEGKAAVGRLVRGWTDGGGLVICAAPSAGEAPPADHVVELRDGSLRGPEPPS